MKRKDLPRWVSYIPLLFLAGIFLLALYVKASAGPLGANEGGTAAYDSPVTLVDGDAIITNQVACSSVSVSTNAVTLLTSTNDPSGNSWTAAATASRTRPRFRKRVFVNTSNFWVFIGSNSATGLLRTSSTKGGFAVGPATTTAMVYETHNSSDFYCNQEGSVANTGAIVTVIEEYNTIP